MVFSFLGEWIREIVILLVLALIIDMALPSSSMRRYVDYTVALILLLLLLTPVLRLLDTPSDLAALFSSFEEQAASTSLAQGELSNRSAWVAYRLVFEERAAQMACALSGVESCVAKVVLDQNPASSSLGSPLSLYVALTFKVNSTDETRETTVETLRQQIHMTFGLKSESISIHIER